MTSRADFFENASIQALIYLANGDNSTVYLDGIDIRLEHPEFNTKQSNGSPPQSAGDTHCGTDSNLINGVWPLFSVPLNVLVLQDISIGNAFYHSGVSLRGANSGSYYLKNIDIACYDNIVRCLHITCINDSDENCVDSRVVIDGLSLVMSRFPDMSFPYLETCGRPSVGLDIFYMPEFSLNNIRVKMNGALTAIPQR